MILINAQNGEWLPAVYTNYLSSKMNLNGKVLYFNNFDSIIFGISSQILKDKPFVAYDYIRYGYGVFVKQRK